MLNGMKTDPFETNSQVEWKVRRSKILSCSYCPPNKGENRGRRNKFHCFKSWKYKTKRKHQYKIKPLLSEEILKDINKLIFDISKAKL